MEKEKRKSSVKGGIETGSIASKMTLVRALQSTPLDLLSNESIS